MSEWIEVCWGCNRIRARKSATLEDLRAARATGVLRITEYLCYHEDCGANAIVGRATP